MEIQITKIKRKKRSELRRNQQRIEGRSLGIGRGTQCQIHLPDPRVDLEQARLSVSGSGARLEAAPGRVKVNGREVVSAKLEVGDRIEIGPYLIEVEAPPEDLPLALAITLAVPLPSTGVESYEIRPPRLSMRRLSYIAFLGTLLMSLLLPIAPDLLGFSQGSSSDPAKDDMKNMVRSVAAKFTEAWNPGPVARSHQSFGADCRTCHLTPFVQVEDFACVSCHTSLKEHVPAASLTGTAGHVFRDTRCAECHRDHKGAQMAPRPQEECANCHRDIQQVAQSAKSGKVTDFRTAHPEFRLSLLDADKPDAIRRVRQGPEGGHEMAERSNLKFNHKLHLDPGGVRDPEGKRDASRAHTGDGKRTVLTCADCHVPGERGRLIMPVSMEEHCQRCHSLAFEPKVTKRQAVHYDQAASGTMLREFYARLVLGDVPPGVNPPANLPRMRPGAVLDYEERKQALKIVDQKAKLVERELFETRKVCTTCHLVTRNKDRAVWEVAPVRLTQVWMPHATFNHAKHSTEQCSRCHDVAQSSESRDVAMPTIATCRECHVGARPVSGKVTSDCALCHKFHAGRDYWHAELQAQMLQIKKK